MPTSFYAVSSLSRQGDDREDIMTLTVEMFGLAPFSEASSVQVDLGQGATIGELVAAIARELPSFVGHVIDPGKTRLIENYGFYINSHLISDHQEVHLNPGARVVLLLLATGG